MKSRCTASGRHSRWAVFGRATFARLAPFAFTAFAVAPVTITTLLFTSLGGAPLTLTFAFVIFVFIVIAGCQLEVQRKFARQQRRDEVGQGRTVCNLRCVVGRWLFGPALCRAKHRNYCRQTE